MKVILQIGVIFGICLLGELISMLIGFSFPGSVISMVLLFLLLLFDHLKTEHLKEISNFLLHNMAFFFLPTAVGIMNSFDLLSSNLLSFFLICLISTIVTFLATAFTVVMVVKLQNKYLQRGEH